MRVEVVEAGSYAFVREIKPGRGESVEVAAELETTALRTASWWVLGSAATGGLAGGITLGLAFKAESDAKRINNKRLAGKPLTAEEIDHYGSRLRDRGRLRAIAGVFILGAIVAGSAGWIMYIADTPPPIVPVIGPNGAGAAMAW